MKDDTLILYYYGDGLSDAERAEIESALESDELLRRRYEALCGELGEFSDAPTVRPPADMVARFHDTIERAARLERGRTSTRERRFHLPSFAWGSAIAATLAIGIGIGYFLQPATAPVALDPDAFSRGLQVHLQQSRYDLANLSVESEAERQMLILHIVQQNRLFERAAEDNRSDDLARLLRAFEPILLRLAADDITPDEAAELQAQLAFELNVTLTKLSRKPSNRSSTT